MDWLKEIPDWLWLTVVGLVTSISLWWRRQASGLNFFQEATDEERDRLEQLQAEIIKQLEKRVEQLEEDNEVLRKALDC